LLNENVPSILRVAAGAFGFLIFNHVFDGPDLYGALSFFETMSTTSSDPWRLTRRNDFDHFAALRINSFSRRGWA
jgi:hypothetical protein